MLAPAGLFASESSVSQLKDFAPAQSELSAPVPAAPEAVIQAPAPRAVAPREYVMTAGRIMQVYKFAADGDVLLFDLLDNGEYYYKTAEKNLERELPAGEVMNGFVKGGTACMKQTYEFDEETGDSGIGGMFQPFPYVAMKGSQLEIVNLYKSGFARMRTVSKYDKRILVRAVDLRLVEPCGK
ncbi:MAG: hypothetical protein PHV36_14700 [Elusimicrobiales bacterium]|nr:hypothetical protein [Elusimicrobiales bacterium]